MGTRQTYAGPPRCAFNGLRKGIQRLQGCRAETLATRHAMPGRGPGLRDVQGCERGAATERRHERHSQNHRERPRLVQKRPRRKRDGFVYGARVWKFSEDVLPFEHMLVGAGIQILMYYLDISKKE